MTGRSRTVRGPAVPRPDAPCHQSHPKPSASSGTPRRRTNPSAKARTRSRGLHSSTFQLNVSNLCMICWGGLLVSVTNTAQDEPSSGRVEAPGVKPCRSRRARGSRYRHPHRVVGARVDIESKTRKRFIMVLFQELETVPFNTGFHWVQLAKQT